MKTLPRIPYCAHCNSTRVLADAWAEWDPEENQWELRSTHDDWHCEDCDGPTRLIWRLPKPQSKGESILQIFDAVRGFEGLEFDLVPQGNQATITEAVLNSRKFFTDREVVKNGVLNLDDFRRPENKRHE